MATYALTSEEEMQARIWWGDYVVNNSDIFHAYWTLYPPPSRMTYLVLAGLVVLIGVASIVGNALVIYSLMRSTKLRKLNLFTINLSLSDLLSCSLTYHMFVVSALNGHWAFSLNVCRYYAAAQGIFAFISITSMAAIALERCAAITQRRSRWFDMSYGTKLSVCACIWIYCFLVMSGPLYGMGKYVAAGFLNTCCFDYIDRSASTRLFITSMFSFGFFVPMSVIVYCYYYIYKATMEAEAMMFSRLKDNQMATVQLSKKDSGTNSTAGENTGATPTNGTNLGTTAALPKSDSDNFLTPDTAGGGDNTSRRSSSNMSFVSAADSRFSVSPTPSAMFKIKGKDKRAAKLCLVVVGIFGITWTPYAVATLLGQFGPDRILTPWMCMFPSVLAKSCTLYNPIVFFSRDNRMKRALKKYVFCQDLPEGQETESRTTHYSDKKENGDNNNVTDDS